MNPRKIPDVRRVHKNASGVPRNPIRDAKIRPQPPHNTSISGGEDGRIALWSLKAYMAPPEINAIAMPEKMNAVKRIPSTLLELYVKVGKTGGPSTGGMEPPRVECY
ncbi:hypothetical protein HDU78_011013 [Chytriomyces hyalinus]|nr:hypothetical protein HDU78_011013 [Chytriomyces hyalinus]